MTRDERRARWALRTETPLLWLSVAFLVVLLVPLYAPNLPRPARAALTAVNAAVWTAFAADYLVRLHLADDRRTFVRRHLLDLLLLAVPALRALRVLRVLSALGVLSRRAQGQAVARATALVAAVTAGLVITAAGLVLDAERDAETANITTAGDALWWASTTMTTVGYGDRYPTTGEGRAVAVVLMFAGVALLGVLTAAFAAWFVSQLDGRRD